MVEWVIVLGVGFASAVLIVFGMGLVIVVRRNIGGGHEGS